MKTLQEFLGSNPRQFFRDPEVRRYLPRSKSGTTGSNILKSPDNTLWQIQVNDSGVLETVQVSAGTAGILHLFSPDGTEWNITVNNSGALTTTAI